MARAPALPPVPILILAAGAARRMGGRDKLLEPVGGVALLRDRALAALTTGAPVFVSLPENAPVRAAVLDGLALTRITAPHAASGMAGSLRDGVAALPPDSAGVLVVLADMPEITGTDMRTLLVAFDGGTALRGADAAGTRPGHPVLLPARLFPMLAGLKGDIGARDILKDEDHVRLVALPGENALTDLDDPDDWAAWRARTGR